MLSRIQPTLNGGYFVLTDDDFYVGEGCYVDAHLAEKKGGEFADGSGADDELTVHTHEALRIELTLGFFEGHIQDVGLAVYSAETDYSVADSDVAHVAHRYDEIFVGTMRDEKTFAVTDGLTLYGG